MGRKSNLKPILIISGIAIFVIALIVVVLLIAPKQTMFTGWRSSYVDIVSDSDFETTFQFNWVFDPRLEARCVHTDRFYVVSQWGTIDDDIRYWKDDLYKTPKYVSVLNFKPIKFKTKDVILGVTSSKPTAIENVISECFIYGQDVGMAIGGIDCLTTGELVEIGYVADDESQAGYNCHTVESAKIKISIPKTGIQCTQNQQSLCKEDEICGNDNTCQTDVNYIPSTDDNQTITPPSDNQTQQQLINGYEIINNYCVQKTDYNPLYNTKEECELNLIVNSVEDISDLSNEDIDVIVNSVSGLTSQQKENLKSLLLSKQKEKFDLREFINENWYFFVAGAVIIILFTITIIILRKK